MTRVTSLDGQPIEQHSSPNVGGAMSGHKGIVLHIAEGGYRGTISWQMNPDQRYASGGSTTTSSTWVVGRNAGEWAQMSDSNTIAWCQRGGSRDWNSIELAGYAPGAPTLWQIEACAQLLAWHHKQYGTPLAVADNPSERGLGHHSMDREWLGEEWGHDSCPGSGVIAAKAAIVARAKEITNGGGGFLMALTDAEQEEILAAVRATRVAANVAGYRIDALVSGKLTYDNQMGDKTAPNVLAQQVAALVKAAGVDQVDEQAIVAGVLAGLTPQAIAAAIPADIAKQVADELAARMAG